MIPRTSRPRGLPQAPVDADELGTNRPIFLGRDSVVRSTPSEIDRERRAGYAYYGTWPASLLDSDFPRWREKQKRP